MRIGIDYTAAIEQRAGIGRYTRELVRALVVADEENSYLLISARGGNRRSSDWPRNVATKDLPFSSRALTVMWQRWRLPLPIELFTGRLDIFHSPDFTLPTVRSSATVVTVHDLTFLVHPECAHPGVEKYLRRAAPRALERASLVLADSQCTRQDLMSYYGIPAARVAVIPAGVGDEFHPVTDSRMLQAVQDTYQAYPPFILTMGTLEPRKNLPRLFEAYARLRQEAGIPHRLLVAGGKGWLYEDIFRAVERLGLQDEVRFLGFVPDHQLPALLTLADVFVYPSLYEGFGLPPLEAMACDVPVVCSNTSSLPEVAGDAALMVDPTDVPALAAAIHRVLTDEALRQSMVEKGREQAARFTWSGAAAELLHLYASLDRGGK